MSDLPQTHGFSGGTTRESQEKVSTSIEEMSIIDFAEPARWTSTSSSTESSELSDIFRVLSDIHLQEPSMPLTADTKDKIKEHGEPNTSTRKRKVEELELELDKLSSEGNEQLLNESKQDEKKAKKPRSLVLHNISERRRRGRINEKIKSLKQLIPNSDKRDCASILDEAIKYLKMLKNQAAQMMSMSMGSVYWNPYMSSIGIPRMPVAQYYPSTPFRPGMGLVPSVPMPFPAFDNPSGNLPLVQGPMELGPSLPLPGTCSLTLLQPKNTAIPTLNLEDHIKEKSPFKKLEKGVCNSQEASASGQIVPKPSPSYIVHATHIVPPATMEENTNS